LARNDDGSIVLLVSTDDSELEQHARILRDDGYEVIEAASFEQARTLLSSLGPDLLITSIQLDAYNGLHLVWRQRMTHPDRPAIITSAYADVVLESEARDLRCPFLVAPVDPDQLLASVHALLGTEASDGDKRRWPRTLLGQTLELGTTQGPAQVVDVSYGGCRLQFRPGADVPLSCTLALPISSDSEVIGTPIWRAPVLDGEEYGVKIGGAQEADVAWRAFVDDLKRRG